MGNGDGGGGGGMTSSFTWLESVNSTMDEVKTLIVNQEVQSAAAMGAAPNCLDHFRQQSFVRNVPEVPDVHCGRIEI